MTVTVHCPSTGCGRVTAVNPQLVAVDYRCATWTCPACLRTVQRTICDHTVRALLDAGARTDCVDFTDGSITVNDAGSILAVGRYCDPFLGDCWVITTWLLDQRHPKRSEPYETRAQAYDAVARAQHPAGGES